MNKKEIPCKKCITLSICKGRVETFEKEKGDIPDFILGVPFINRCPLVKDYIHNNRVDIEEMDYVKNSMERFKVLYDYLNNLEGQYQ